MENPTYKQWGFCICSDAFDEFLCCICTSKIKKVGKHFGSKKGYKIINKDIYNDFIIYLSSPSASLSLNAYFSSCCPLQDF